MGGWLGCAGVVGTIHIAYYGFRSCLVSTLFFFFCLLFLSFLPSLLILCLLSSLYVSFLSYCPSFHLIFPFTFYIFY